GQEISGTMGQCLFDARFGDWYAGVPDLRTYGHAVLIGRDLDVTEESHADDGCGANSYHEDATPARAAAAICQSDHGVQLMFADHDPGRLHLVRVASCSEHFSRA